MFSSKSLFFILILSGLVFTLGSFSNSVYGHGMTSEVLQSDILEGKGVSLNLYSTTSPTEQNHREIYFELMDSETDELINEVTFLIKVSQNKETILDNSFQTDDGILILDMNMIDESFSKIVQRDSEFDDPQKLKNAKMKNIPNVMDGNVSGGLYEFEIKILSMGNYSDKLDEPIVFESGLSFPSSEFFEVDIPNYGIQEFGLIGYYEQPYGFDYNSETREITFLMPYSWPEHTEEDTFFVHNEILIPKSFGDLRYENFSAYVNGIDQTESVFNVDFALEKALQVHLVTTWGQFDELSEKLEDENGYRPSVLEYLFVPTDPDAPFSSVTHGGRYRINLSWEPADIVAGSETKFFIEILDIYTKDKPVPTDYHFTVIHGDKEIFHQSDVSTNPTTKTTELDFLVPDDVSGPITIRFENLGGGIFSNLDFPAIVKENTSYEESVPILDSPRKQMADGIENIECKSGLILLEKYSGILSCVSPSTAEKLVERSWGMFFDYTKTAYDSLPSWNDLNSKQKIIEFVKNISEPTSSAFVPIKDRIATFDNDGTLWIEQPLYIPFEFHLEYLYQQLEDDPSLSSQNPYKEILGKNDLLSNKDLEEIPELINVLLPAYPGISQAEYLLKSKDFLDNTKHVRYDVALKELTYLPMVELVSYLQENDFQVYIVSAGFQGLMRSVSDEAYDIPPENVIGTYPEFKSELTENGSVLIRQPTIASFNDGDEKPVNIQKFIGKIPIFACGNSGGDIEMLTLVDYHENHFGCMLNHDDELREYYYPNAEALDASKQNDWLVISMKNDFKTIFANLE